LDFIPSPINRLKIDNKTLRDLDLFIPEKGLFSYFDKTRTTGGQNKLRALMKNPRKDIGEIRSMQKTLEILAGNILIWDLDITNPLVDEVTLYLRSNYLRFSGRGFLVAHFVKDLLAIERNDHFFRIESGLLKLHHLMGALHNLWAAYRRQSVSPILKSYLVRLSELFSLESVKEFVIRYSHKKKVRDTAFYDGLFRFDMVDRLWDMINLVYEIDALVSLAKTHSAKSLTFPRFEESGTVFEIQEAYHPFLCSPVKNDLTFLKGKNLSLITGPNMAGKTTYMKTCGLCAYLAHLGVGVPASRMVLPPLDGLFVSFNMNDDISKGYSYFYSEVDRIKTVACHLNEKQKIFALFDELFKGTNVKDAHDGAELVISGLVNWKACFFMVSTHMVELAVKIKRFNSIQFKFFDLHQNGEEILFDYRLKDGISDKTIGLQIIKDAGIPRLLNSPGA
jgi:DNA mismatch repair ATPase MutS